MIGALFLFIGGYFIGRADELRDNGQYRNLSIFGWVIGALFVIFGIVLSIKQI